MGAMALSDYTDMFLLILLLINKLLVAPCMIFYMAEVLLCL